MGTTRKTSKQKAKEAKRHKIREAKQKQQPPNSSHSGSQEDPSRTRAPTEKHDDNRHEFTVDKSKKGLEKNGNSASLPQHIVKKRNKMSVQEICDWIAELSESILENPEVAFQKKASLLPHKTATKADSIEPQDVYLEEGMSKMAQLVAFAEQPQDSQEDYTAQLAIMSLLAIFQDILPAYRIRLPTQQEMAIKVSKDTKKLWDYERALLQQYQQYLKLLERCWSMIKQHSSKGKLPIVVRPTTRSLAVTAMLSLCELMKSAFHFNFRSNLITMVVRNMNSKEFPQVSTACCQAIEHVFQNDSQGEVALEIVRQVAKLIKDRNYHVQPAVLRTFAALPLRVHADEAEAAKLATKANAKKRKRDKEAASIEAELKESSANVDKILLARCQSDMLQAITLTYFRILKHDHEESPQISAQMEALLPASLEGVAKFAHLINFETVMDILKVLSGLLKRVDALPLDASLNCVLTAFHTLQGPGREMKIDQKEYIVPLYSLLPRLCSDVNNTDLMIQCLASAFLKRREYSTVRVAAFCKQIFTVAMHAPPHTAIPLLALARQLLQRYPTIQAMVTDSEQDVITAGEYTPDVEDPEHCNPMATCAWELATLKFHYYGATAAQATSAANLKLLQLPSEEPSKLRKLCLDDMNALYVPFQRMKKRHPLEAKKTEPGGSTRRDVRFITPRNRTIFGA